MRRAGTTASRLAKYLSRAAQCTLGTPAAPGEFRPISPVFARTTEHRHARNAAARAPTAGCRTIRVCRCCSIATPCPIAGSDPAAAFEDLFERNGWPPQWRNGVYGFHHYHTTAHEVLGFAAGRARLVLGGPAGTRSTSAPAMSLVLPAGTGPFPPRGDARSSRRRRLSAGSVGRPATRSGKPEMLARIAAVPVPLTDPVKGKAGPLTSLWRA